MTQSGIIRAQRDRNNPYSMMRRAIFNDRRISWAAKGLVGYLLTKPDGWQIMIADLVNQYQPDPDEKGRKPRGGGRDAVYAILNELRRYGYLTTKMERDEWGQITGWTKTVHETPVEPEVALQDDPTEPLPAEPDLVADHPLPAEPDTAEPYRVKPYIYRVENQESSESLTPPVSAADDGEEGADDELPSGPSYVSQNTLFQVIEGNGPAIGPVEVRTVKKASNGAPSGPPVAEPTNGDKGGARAARPPSPSTLLQRAAQAAANARGVNTNNRDVGPVLSQLVAARVTPAEVTRAVNSYLDAYAKTKMLWLNKLGDIVGTYRGRLASGDEMPMVENLDHAIGRQLTDADRARMAARAVQGNPDGDDDWA